MAPKQRLIFATKSDLIPGIMNLESRHPLKYIVESVYDSNDDVLEYDSLLQFSDLGIHKTGEHIHGSLLVMDHSKEVQIEARPQRTGGIKYFVEEDGNPFAIAFWPGGIFKDTFLIRGTIRTRHSDNDVSNELFKVFSKEITKGFQKIENCYIGPEALSLAKKGQITLISNHYKEPQEYNVKIDS